MFFHLDAVSARGTSTSIAISQTQVKKSNAIYVQQHQMFLRNILVQSMNLEKDKTNTTNHNFTRVHMSTSLLQTT